MLALGAQFCNYIDRALSLCFCIQNLTSKVWLFTRKAKMLTAVDQFRFWLCDARDAHTHTHRIAINVRALSVLCCCMICRIECYRKSRKRAHKSHDSTSRPSAFIIFSKLMSNVQPENGKRQRGRTRVWSRVEFQHETSLSEESHKKRKSKQHTHTHTGENLSRNKKIKQNQVCINK